MSWTKGRGPANLPSRVKALVIQNYGTACYNCGQPYDQIDHLTPWSQGGKTVLTNLRPICRGCHDEKSRSEAREGYARRQKRLKLPEDPRPFDHL